MKTFGNVRNAEKMFGLQDLQFDWGSELSRCDSLMSEYFDEIYDEIVRSD